MDTRKVWSICGSAEETGFFDIDTNALRDLETRDVLVKAAKKDYISIKDWE